MIAATPTPSCAPSSVGSASTIYSTTSDIGGSSRCFAFEWTSSTTGSVTTAFQLQHKPDYWYLDDTSVYEEATQILTNGNFETGSLSPWIRTTPNGSCTGIAGRVNSTTPRSGNYSLRDRSNSCADQISQNFMASADHIYVISFWLRSGSSGSGISAKVTLS